MAMEKRTDMGSIKIRTPEFRRNYGIKFLEAVVNRYPQMDEYWILARRKERLDKLAGKYKNKKVVVIEMDLSNESSYDGLVKKLENEKSKVKVLVNNAGYEKSGKFVDMRKEDMDSINYWLLLMNIRMDFA